MMARGRRTGIDYLRYGGGRQFDYSGLDPPGNLTEANPAAMYPARPTVAEEIGASTVKPL